MSTRATRRSGGKRERRRRFDATLKKVLRLEREGHSPRAIADSLQVSRSFVETILEDFIAGGRVGERMRGEGVLPNGLMWLYKGFGRGL